jgi:hypothetical protein
VRLDIRECQYEGAWIEVGLKAVVSSRSSNRANGSNMNDSYRSNTTTVEQADPSLTNQRFNELM